MPQTPDDSGRGLTWTTISDFAAGIVDKSQISGISPTLLASEGAATTATSGCVALPSGGLGPLPALINTYNFPADVSTGQTWYITGMIVNPQNVNGPEVFLIAERDNGTNHYVRAWSIVIGGATNEIKNPSGSTPLISAATTPGYFGSPYPAFTRIISQNDSPTTTPGAPCLVFPAAVATDSNHNSGHLYVFPANSSGVYPWGGSVGSPGTPGFQVADLVTYGSEVTGQFLPYQSRLVTLSGVNYPWPGFLVGGINVNEQICFTDPPNSDNYQFQQEIFSWEDPFGYGAMGSQSAGELFLIKKYQGGDYIAGDVYNPSSVTFYPGVMPTGDFYGNAAGTSLGLVYCSQNNGAWAWNGGNTSVKISSQLDDEFFDVEQQINMPSNNYGFFCYQWNDYILFSNNYVYNMITNSWWKLGFGSSSTVPLYHYSVSSAANQFFAAPLQVTHANPIALYEYDSTVGQGYTWQSTPYEVSDDRVVDMRSVTAVLSNGSGEGTATFTFSIQDAAGVQAGTTLTTVNVTGNTPTMFRFNAGTAGGSGGLQGFQVSVTTTVADGAVPIVHQIGLGYQISNSKGVAN